jgi:hypothetical protein
MKLTIAVPGRTQSAAGRSGQIPLPGTQQHSAGRKSQASSVLGLAETDVKRRIVQQTPVAAPCRIPVNDPQACIAIVRNTLQRFLFWQAAVSLLSNQKIFSPVTFFHQPTYPLAHAGETGRFIICKQRFDTLRNQLQRARLESICFAHGSK